MSASVPGAERTASAQRAFAIALVDEFVRAGMTEAVVCPGSRSTPLVLALAASPLSLHVRLDERGAGFFAIGRSLATRRPVAVVVTSGTAATELAPAVAEADLSRVPLVVVTADRPPELRGIGAPQTIDQVKLYGAAVRRAEDPGTIRPESSASWRPLAARVVAAAVELEGPVHLNVPLVEPLDAPPAEVPEGRAGGRPWRERHPARRTADWVPSSPNGLVLAGRGADARVLGAAAYLGWPVLADPLSHARCAHPCVVAAFDALLRDPALRTALRPDEVVLLGSLPASRAAAEALVDWGARVVQVAASRADDPLGVVTDVVPVSPAEWCDAALDRPPAGATLLARWQAADAAAQSAFDEALRGELSEPAVARLVSRLVGDVALVVSNSMPVRDLEWFGAKPESPGTVHANRGANGIDGVVSTALGVATGARAVGVLGDLAFLHDVGALADGLGEAGGTCALVVLDNRGGGIFSFLPQRRSVDHRVFERAFATPPRVELAAVASGFGVEVATVKDPAALEASLAAALRADGVSVVVCAVPDRDRNVELHRELGTRAADAARAAVLP